MAFRDFLRPDPGGRDPRTPEVRRRGDWFNRVPDDYKKDVEWVATKNHRHYADRFPSYEEFLDAVAESWIETKRRFEEETRRLGFVPIDPEMKASALNKHAIALLSAHGSVLLFGPGGFERNIDGAPGAALSYVKIPLREHEGLLENTDQAQGVFFVTKPGIGKLIKESGVRSSTHGPGSEHVVFTSTAPAIVAMCRETESGRALPVLAAAKAGLTRVFEEVHQEAGLALARPGRNDPAKK